MKTLVDRCSPRQVDFVLMIVISFAFVTPPARAETPAEKRIQAMHGLEVIVKMVGPVTQATDLQIICILKHDPAGDKYIEAMQDLDKKLGGLLSSLRERGEFVGEPGETLLFMPPPNSIVPSRVLLIGVGDEASLTLDRLRLIGRIASRQAVQLNAAHVSFAPTLRDQGSSRIDVAEGDAAVVEQFLLAYDSERRLQAEGLSPKHSIEDLTIEAGPKFFNGAVEKVTASVATAGEQIKLRNPAPYHASQHPR
jgi:hypothetical protein